MIQIGTVPRGHETHHVETTDIVPVFNESYEWIQHVEKGPRQVSSCCHILYCHYKSSMLLILFVVPMLNMWQAPMQHIGWMASFQIIFISTVEEVNSLIPSIMQSSSSTSIFHLEILLLILNLILTHIRTLGWWWQWWFKKVLYRRRKITWQ